LAAKVQTNSEKKTTKLYFHTQGFAGDPKKAANLEGGVLGLVLGGVLGGVLA
jgi:hypothetical protein